MLIKPKHKLSIPIASSYEKEFKTYLLYETQKHLLSCARNRNKQFRYNSSIVSYHDLISNLKVSSSEIYFDYDVELIVRHLIFDLHQGFWNSVFLSLREQVDAYYFYWISNQKKLSSKKYKPLPTKRIDL